MQVLSVTGYDAIFIYMTPGEYRPQSKIFFSAKDVDEKFHENNMKCLTAFYRLFKSQVAATRSKLYFM